MLYLLCMSCEDKFIMDENFVEIPNDNGLEPTRKIGLDYQGHDCLCPICETFSGRLIGD